MGQCVIIIDLFSMELYTQIEENAGDLPSSGSKALKKKVSIRSKSLHLLANILKTIIDREKLLLAEMFS